ncbi:hypothetical protein SAY87_027795 [Trapa incisa]|uniref:EF-hand domain-containing protein n=1 Tax=Trapa incisa TaxID=236973 RepID=A0AAN7PKM1_9MYRT|nr:hypothetical protein SAY87_027795 [Trapa incisa]
MYKKNTPSTMITLIITYSPTRFSQLVRHDAKHANYLKRIFLILQPYILLFAPSKLWPLFLLLIHLRGSPCFVARWLRRAPPDATSPPPFLRPAAQSPMDPVELKRLFQMFDRNGDGRITKKELSDSLGNLGMFIPNKELEDMIERIDVNGDGCVDIEEFEALYGSIMGERDEEAEDDMKEAFNVFDQNGDGFITVDELRSMLASMGLNQGRTIEDCKRMIMKVDDDGDGRVNFNEFKQMMKGGGFSAFS